MHSGKAFDSGTTGESGEDSYTSPYDPTLTRQHWKLEAISDVTDGYKLIPVAYPQFYLDVSMGYADDGRVAQVYNPLPHLETQNFKITKNDDGTFSIYTAGTEYTKALDAQYEDKELDEKQIIKQNTLPDGELKQSMKWYFYPVEATEDKTISTSATYTENQNFVSTMTDQRGNETTYNYNETTGTLTSVTDASNNTTSYVYNANNNALQSVTSGGMTNSYTYFDDRLTDINVNGGTRYQFVYDSFGRTTYTKVGNGLAYRNLSQLIYNGNGLLEKQEYGNGDYITFSYDNLDRLIGKSYNGSSTDKVEYFYGADGNISKTIDYSTNTETKYVYDLAGRLVAINDYSTTWSNFTTAKASIEYTYADKTNYLTGIKHYNALGTQNIGYRYGDLANGEMPDQIYGVTWNGKEQVSYTYDSLGRLTSKLVGGGVLDTPLNTAYNYVDVDSTRTTTLLSSLETDIGTYSYTYDELGNITSINDGTYTASYVYDELNQLVRENDPYAEKTRTFEYENGNITYIHEYAYTTSELPSTPVKTIKYHYEDDTWGDVLTKMTYYKYNTSNVSTASAYSLRDNSETALETLSSRIMGRNGNRVDLTANSLFNANYEGTVASAYSLSSEANLYATEHIESDEIGNITRLFGNSITWNGRRAESVQKNNILITYDYNIDGQRVKKTITDTDTNTATTTEYFYNGSILAGEKTGNDVIIFMYDNNGDIFGFTYNGTPYYYIKNAQNDVIAVVNDDLSEAVFYEYDAWGNIVECLDYSDNNLSAINPITYRSYYYDIETGVYYLNSRYYVSVICRFLSADSVVSGVGQEPLGYNMFAYCMNNPVNMSDADGNWPKWATKVLVGVAVIAAAAVVTVATGGAAAGTLVAAVHCVAVGALKGAIVGAVVGAVSGAVTGAVSHRVTTGSWEGAGQAALESGATGFMTGAITGAITGGKNSNVCFVAGTSVLTSVGLVAIENIRSGDWVWAENPDTGEKELKQVVQTFINETSELVHVYVNGEEITTTPEHPFYVPQKGWTSAIELHAGDILVLQNGKYVVVEKVQHEILEEPVTVYNFEVEDFHTYYVGDSSILVHNVCGAKNTPNQNAVIQLAKENKNGLSLDDAKILVEWAKEYGLNNHGPMTHPNRSGIWSFTEHVKIFNEHIPII